MKTCGFLVLFLGTCFFFAGFDRAETVTRLAAEEAKAATGRIEKREGRMRASVTEQAIGGNKQ